jgi:flagellar hook-associated protein 3 FlgL
MSMRVTNNVMTNRLLADLRAGYARMAQTQDQISSGKRINKPSDDALGAARARLQRAELEGIERHRAGAGTATSWLDASETALSRVNDQLQRARELVVQGANGTLSKTDRSRIADEIDQLAASAKDVMSIRVGDTYIFSGTDTTQPPYTAAGGDAYLRNTATILRDVGPGVSIQLNAQVPTVPSGTAPLTGRAILGDGPGAADGRVLDTLRTIAAHLRSGAAADVQALGTTDLQALDANLRAVTDARAAVGATQNRVDAAITRLDDLEATGKTVLSDIEDTDLAQALSDLSMQQTAYQAALRSGAQIIQPSLMDFLR